MHLSERIRPPPGAPTESLERQSLFPYLDSLETRRPRRVGLRGSVRRTRSPSPNEQTARKGQPRANAAENNFVTGLENTFRRGPTQRH